MFVIGCAPIDISRDENLQSKISPKRTIRDSSLKAPIKNITVYPNQIGLLIPLSGENKNYGTAIQKGFLSAYFFLAKDLDSLQIIKIYDINNFEDASEAYRQAVKDGAEFIVGPLMQESVVNISKESLLPINLLALNNLPKDIKASLGMYQFALSLEDEILSAAHRAIADGNIHATILTPNNELGKSFQKIFSDEFEKLGGIILKTESYELNEKDFSYEIKNLMGIAESEARYERLRANIRENLAFEPRRRQDIDMIFLVSDASIGRLIKPQLKFYYSGEVPVYSISTIYTTNKQSYDDLHGIIFSDSPWTIDPQSWIELLPEIFEKYWPGSFRQNRLHAMGFDAYLLANKLFSHQNGVIVSEINGTTGQLYLDKSNRLHRRLAWAQFINGDVVALPDPLIEKN